MKTWLRYILLFIPLFFLGTIWLGVVFGIKIIPDGLLFDDTYEYSGDGRQETGLIPLSWFNAIAFVVIIFGSLGGLVYTAYKNLWWWFLAYIILAVFPLSLFMFA